MLLQSGRVRYPADLAPGQTFAHQFGDSGNGVLRGPDQVNVDFSVIKNFHITEGQITPVSR